MLQIALQPVLQPGQSDQAVIFLGPLLVYSLLIILLLVLAIFFIRYYLRFKNKYNSSFDKKIYKISLPKNEGLKDDSTSGNDLQKIQEIIGMGESFFTSLGGMKAEKGVKSQMKGRGDHISFEIVAKNNLISFYVAVPNNLERFLVQQIHAQYPDAQIDEVKDYNIFKSNSSVLGSYLVFTRRHAFPIKTYKNIETDPLNAITNSLSKLSENEGAVIQVVVRSANKQWRSMGRDIVARLEKGESPEKINKIGLGKFVTKGFDVVFNAWAKKDPNDPSTQDNKHQLSPLEQKMVESIEEKISRAGLDVNIRVIVATDNMESTKKYLTDINNSFAQYNIYEYGNSLKPLIMSPNNKVVSDFIYRNFSEKRKMILNTEELASIFHFPHKYIETPNIDWLSARRAVPPNNLTKEGLLLGISEYRGENIDIKIKRSDRRRHVYIIGQTGTGKSTIMKNMMIQDIKNGEGCCVIDPHGDFALDMLKNIPKERADDVIYFNPADTERPIGLNMLEFDTPEQKTFVVNELLSIFDKLYDLKATGGPMFEQYMRNALLLIMEHPESGMTLMEISRVLADEDFRKLKLSKCKNMSVKDFWEKEAQKAGGEAALANMVPYITSKLTPFIANDIMRPIIAQQKSSIDFREIMDKKKILLVNLTKGKLGEMNSSLLGMIIVGKILLASLSRVDIPEEDRKDFYLYIDEFQNFTTDSIAIILSEARKYRLCLTIAHQYIGQLIKNNDTSIRDAVFGNVGTTVSYRIGVDDAELLAKQFAPVFNEYDVINIPKYTAYIKLLIDNANPPAFNIKIPKDPEGSVAMQKAVIELSRLKYGKPREIIEQEIRERTKMALQANKNNKT